DHRRLSGACLAPRHQHPVRRAGRRLRQGGRPDQGTRVELPATGVVLPDPGLAGRQPRPRAHPGAVSIPAAQHRGPVQVIPSATRRDTPLSAATVVTWVRSSPAFAVVSARCPETSVFTAAVCAPLAWSAFAWSSTLASAPAGPTLPKAPAETSVPCTVAPAVSAWSLACRLIRPP